MKTTVYLLLAFSLAGNLALAVKLRSPAAVAATDAAPDSSAALRAGSHSNLPTAGRGGAASAAEHKSPPSAAANTAGLDWSALSATGDLKELVASLRAAGFPPAVVHAIVSAELHERSASRRKAVAQEPAYEYWSTRSPFTSDPAALAARREIARENERTLKELLGGDARRENPFMSLFERRQYGDLPRDKVELLRQITQDYSDLTSQVRAEMQGLTLPEDRQKLAFLEAEKRKDIAQVLTPQEFEEYMLRTSSTASSMRYQLAAFEPSEQEFRTLYTLQAAFDEKFSTLTGTVGRTAEGMEQRRQAEQKLVADVKTALGEARGAEFERSRDYTYQAAANVAQRYGLPKETATTVWTVQRDINERASKIRSDSSIPIAQRTQQLAAMQQEAMARVSAALGERGYAAYKDTGGYWIYNLNPPQSPKK